MFSESCEKILKILKEENNFKIQIISREDIKLFLEILDYHQIDFNYNCWNNDKEDKSNVQIFCSIKYLQLDHPKIILFSNELNFNFLHYIFVPSYKDKLNYLPEYKKLLDSRKIAPIHELKNKKFSYEKYIEEYFDYQEILLVYAISKNTNVIEIIKYVKNMNDTIKSTFMLRMKLNGLVQKKIVLFKNNCYKLNISLQMLNEICKKADINIYE